MQSSSISLVEIGSNAEQGSSIDITSGFIAIARAMQIRCCCPPDKSVPFTFSLSFTSSQIAARRSDSSTFYLDYPIAGCIKAKKYTIASKSF